MRRAFQRSFLETTTHLQQGGHAFQSLRIRFLVVDVTDNQATEPLPEVCQKPTEHNLAAVLRVYPALHARPLLPGHEHLSDQ